MGETMSLRWHWVRNAPFPGAFVAYGANSKLAVGPIAYDNGRKRAWGLFHVRKGHPVKLLCEAKTAKEAKAEGDAWALEKGLP